MGRAKTQKEGELYRSRIEREQRLPDELRDRFRTGSPRELPAGRRPLRGVRHRAEAARTQQVEVIRSYDLTGALSCADRNAVAVEQIQGGARAISPAVAYQKP
jgi:hypothetical protein